MEAKKELTVYVETLKTITEAGADRISSEDTIFWFSMGKIRCRLKWCLDLGKIGGWELNYDGKTAICETLTEVADALKKVGQPETETDQQAHEINPSRGAYYGFIDRIAYYGFRNETDDETGLPSCYSFRFEPGETARLIVPRDWHDYTTGKMSLTIDKLGYSAYGNETKRNATQRTVFFSGTIDIADLEFVDKLMESIFPTYEESPY